MARYALLLLCLTASLGLGVSARAAEPCFSCHAAPGLVRRITEGRGTDPQAEALLLKGKAHAALRCAQCHPQAATVPHPEGQRAVACVSCHEHYQGHVVHHRDSTAATAPRLPTCVDCHGHHGILPPGDPQSPVSHRRVADLCDKCHGPQSSRPSARSYLDSVHGRTHEANPSGRAAVCTDCHGAHAQQQGDTLISLVSRSHLPTTCGKCHPKEGAVYRASIHGQAIARDRTEAAVCTDCHGEHNIQRVASPTSPVSASHISETCARCHADARIVRLRALPADRVKSYESSYHGAASGWGDTRVANCTSCHGYHDILPASDPNSSISPANIARTCSQCHPGTQIKYTAGDIHVGRASLSFQVVKWVRIIYLLLIGGTLAGMGGYILFDLLAFVRWRRQGGLRRFEEGLAALPQPPPEALLRLNRNERIQHWVLFITFTLLALSGLPLMAPQHWLSRAVVALCGGPTGRAMIHRVAGVGLLGGAAYHIGYLFLTARGRRWLWDMLPKKKDVLDVWQTARFFFGLSDERPRFARFSFPEKLEYVGVVWGSFVMGLTGLLMWFENLSLQHLPKWAWDGGQAIHGWEAVLAVAVIALWHMYHTVWKPGIRPGNRSWLSGSLTFHQLMEEHPLVYEETMKERGGAEDQPAPTLEHDGETSGSH